MAKKSWMRCLTASALAACLGALSISWWIDFGEQPAKSDIIVILAGEPARSAYAAELFSQGYAPDVWLSRPTAHWIGRPQPDEFTGEARPLRKVVPKDRFHAYEREVGSTVGEAEGLRRVFPSRNKRILLVTSREHARRARLIFRRCLPEADIRVASMPDKNFTRAWWTRKIMAKQALLEALKTAYFLAGGRRK